MDQGERVPVDMGKRVLLVWWTRGKENSTGLVDHRKRILVDQGKSVLVDMGKREFYWSGGPGERVLLVWWTREKENSAGLLDQGKRESYWSGGPGEERVLLVWWTRGKDNSGGPGETRILLVLQFSFFVIIDHWTSGNFDPWLMFALSGPRRWARGTWSGQKTTAWRRSCR